VQFLLGPHVGPALVLTPNEVGDPRRDHLRGRDEVCLVKASTGHRVAAREYSYPRCHGSKLFEQRRRRRQRGDGWTVEDELDLGAADVGEQIGDVAQCQAPAIRIRVVDMDHDAKQLVLGGRHGPVTLVALSHAPSGSVEPLRWTGAGARDSQHALRPTLRISDGSAHGWAATTPRRACSRLQAGGRRRSHADLGFARLCPNLHL
jgi:hypothetical protein